MINPVHLAESMFFALAPRSYYERKKVKVERRLAELKAGAEEAWFEERRSLEIYRGWEDTSPRKIWAIRILGLVSFGIIAAGIWWPK